MNFNIFKSNYAKVWVKRFHEDFKDEKFLVKFSFALLYVIDNSKNKDVVEDARLFFNFIYKKTTGMSYENFDVLKYV